MPTLPPLVHKREQQSEREEEEEEEEEKETISSSLAQPISSSNSLPETSLPHLPLKSRFGFIANPRHKSIIQKKLADFQQRLDLRPTRISRFKHAKRHAVSSRSNPFKSTLSVLRPTMTDSLTPLKPQQQQQQRQRQQSPKNGMDLQRSAGGVKLRHRQLRQLMKLKAQHLGYSTVVIKSDDVSSEANQMMKEGHRMKREAHIKEEKISCWFVFNYLTQNGLSNANRHFIHGSVDEDSTYVDLGDSTTLVRHYGKVTLDLARFRRKRKEIFISKEAAETMTSCPEHRTLISLDKVRRELQRVAVFSEYPIKVQEALMHRLMYLPIGPKRVIMRRGHDPWYFYIIISGHAYSKAPEVDEVTGKTFMTAAQFLRTGDTFGGMDLIKRQRRHYTVISRTNMQLLAIAGQDYLEQFWFPTLKESLFRPDLAYLGKMNFMENFPMKLLGELRNLQVCTLHNFRRNAVIVKDSIDSNRLFIVKNGYCKVFRKLDLADSKVKLNEAVKFKSVKRVPSLLRLAQDRTQHCDWSPRPVGESRAGQAQGNTVGRVKVRNLSCVGPKRVRSDDDQYVERDSAWVTYTDILSPMGNPVRLPVTKLQEGQADEPLPLEDAKGLRQFLPLRLLKEGDVFGLDQTSLCPHRRDSRAVILVSLGAEVIALKKNFYCEHTRPETYEEAQKTFIYDDKLISSRLKSRVNRDVHMEAVLDHYFTKASLVRRSTMPEV